MQTKPTKIPHIVRHKNGMEMPLRNLGSQRYESLKGFNSRFLRSMNFTKKNNKKGLKKMQANNVKNVRAEAIQEVTHSANQRAKLKWRLMVPAQPQASALVPAPTPAGTQRSQDLCEGQIVKTLSANKKTDGLA